MHQRFATSSLHIFRELVGDRFQIRILFPGVYLFGEPVDIYDKPDIHMSPMILCVRAGIECMSDPSHAYALFK